MVVNLRRNTPRPEQRGRQEVKDAIVYGYDWETANASERVALALARVGVKVLHCDSAASAIKKPNVRLRQIESNLFTFRPWVYSHRLNRLPALPRIQSDMVVRQIFDHARSLGMEKPVFLYANLGKFLAPLCEAVRQRGCRLVHVAIDYVENLSPLHVVQSDLTLAFSRTLCHRMRAVWGDKIHQVPHGIDLRPFRNLRASPENPAAVLSGVPRPRLGYAGAFASDFLNNRLHRELLESRPDWNFASFQARTKQSRIAPVATLSNAHSLPWQAPREFAECVASFDVGLMPYDCSNTVLYNGPPMKLWDYFALGIPVVATPLIHLWEYEGLLFLGETANELERAVQKALAEPTDSPLRQKRKELAEQHSMEALGRILQSILG